MRTATKLQCWLLLAIGLLSAPTMYGAPCTYSVSPSGVTHGNGATANSFTVLAGPDCAWEATTTNAWITLVGSVSGTSTGTVNYAVLTNSSVVGRTGVVLVAGQVYTVRQDPAPCNFKLTPTSQTRGPGGGNDNVDVTAVAGCAWGVINTNTWITLTGATNGVGNGTVNYSVAPNTTPLYRTGLLFIADQVFPLIQRSAACLYEISPTNRSHGYTGSMGTNTVSTGPNCTWTVENTNSWITIIVNPSGTGPGTFVYNVAPNPNAFTRSGTFRVFDEVFTVFQQLTPCSVQIAPTSAPINADRHTNSVVVTSPGNCSWGVTNTNSWITVFPLSGTGNGSVTWSVPDNASNLGRTGVVQIAGNNFTIRQAALNCTYKLSDTNRNHGYATTTNFVDLDTLNLCPWNVVNTNSWITITSAGSGVGDARIEYVLAANTNVADRSGFVAIDGQQLFINQRGISCALTVSPDERPHGHGFASNFISVLTTPGCTWDVINTNSWISIVPGFSGVYTGDVYYTVAPNPTPFPRSGYITIKEGSTLITQSGQPCSYVVTPTKVKHGYGATSNYFDLITTNGCPWTVVNTNPWISLVGTPGGINSQTISYLVQANPNPSERVGVLLVDGQTFTITQAAVICEFDLSPSMRNHGYGGTNGTVNVATATGCAWPVVNTNPWISVLSSTGLGTGSVSYTISANLDQSPRMGTLQIGDQSFVITQAAYLCSFKLSPTNRNQGFGANTNFFDVIITAGVGCTWSATTTNDWITVQSGGSGTGNGRVYFTFAPNYGTTTRVGRIVVADEVMTITQSASTDGFGFETIGPGLSGGVTMKLEGGPPGIWEIQSSTDLATWTRVGDITNTTGRVEYTVPSLGNQRFFRAVLR